MSRILQFIKKHDNITMLIILAFTISTFTFCIELDANDELWNFSNIYKMTNGYILYKDINVIITPLFFYIGQLVFMIFGKNYLVFRIYYIFAIYMCMFELIYILLKKLKIQKKNAILYTLLFSIIVVLIVRDASYNMMAITFVILGIFNAIKQKNKIIDYIVQGIIIFLVFMTKQNIGFLYIISFICFSVFNYKLNKNTIKNICLSLFTFAVLLFTYLFCIRNNNLYEFINYAFLGIKEFATENFRSNIGNIILLLLEITTSIFFIISTYLLKIPLREEQKINLRILAITSIFMNFIAYPLINTAHTIIGSIIFAITIIYFLDFSLFSEILSGVKINKIKIGICIFTISIVVCVNIIANIEYIMQITDNNYYFDNNNPYYGSIAKQETIDEINEICTYIENQNKLGIEVKVISYYSNLYMNLLNKNNGDMDLPFYGNFGKNGEEGLISKIKELSNTKILILTEEDNFYQESKKIMKYIKENYEYEGKINRFSIYNVK